MVHREPTTRSAGVHAQLREDVLRGRLEPGSRLRFVELAERFSVSQSVVREALTRLAEQGLAVALPQQGFRVTPLDRRDLDELTEARVLLESAVLQQAIERGDLSWESSVVAAHHQLVNTPKLDAAGELNSAWFPAHEHYHQSLLRGCGNSRLFALTNTLRDAASLYRWWSAPTDRDHQREVDEDHRQLLDAVLGRDRQAGAATATRHITRSTQSLRQTAPAEPVELSA